MTPTNHIDWQSASGRGFTLHAPAGSYAARHLDSELRQAQAIVSELVRILQPGDAVDPDPIEIYLVDPTLDASILEAPARPGNNGDSASEPYREPFASGSTILKVVQPDAPGEPLAMPLTRVLIARWFGPYAASADVVVVGLAGVVAANTKTGPAIAECNEWVQSEMEAAGQLSALTRLRDAGKSTDAAVVDRSTLDPALTSFVAFLLANYGGPALRSYFTQFDPDRFDRASTAAYGQTLGVLEEAWLAGMKRKSAGASDDAFRRLVRMMWPLLRPYRWMQAEIFFLSVVSAILTTFPLALGTKQVLNILKQADGVPHQGVFTHRLLPLLGLLFFLFAVEALASLRRAYAVSWLNQNVLLELQLRMFKHLQRLPHSYYERAKLGDVMSRLTGDLDNVQSALSQLTNKGLYQTCLFFSAAAAIVTAAPNLWLDLAVLSIVPLFALTYVGMRNRNKQASREQRKRVGQTTTTTQEVLSAHQVVKAYGMEDAVIHAYRNRLDAQRRSKLRLAILNGIADLSEDLTTQFAQMVVFLMGGVVLLLAVDQSGLESSSVIAAVTVVNKLFKPVAALSTIGQTVQQAAGSMERVNELFDEPVTIEDKPDAVELPALGTAIELDQVMFSYGTGRPVLKDLSLRIPAGTSVAFVGPSGCGKSTTVSLLLRFWDPEKGRVLFDGHDLRDVTLESLRAQIGYVFQDTFIFDNTVRANIAIGRPDATDQEIASAARAARLESFINSLPNGYDTVLGERGVRMSGGQRQRLAIARAILRDPPVLILDEATSALDAKTEAEILETLSEIAKSRTTISITHRLSWAARADKIFVLQKGRLVEEGSHDELIREDGLYKRLYEEQTGFVTGGRDTSVVEINRLREVPLFSGLDEQTLNHLARRLRREVHDSGVDVVRQDDRGDKLYLIGQGQVEVLVSDRTGERRVAELRNGDYFGEMSLLTDAPRTASVRTLVPTQVYTLLKTDFDNLLEEHEELRAAISSTVEARRVALASVETRQVAQRSSAVTQDVPPSLANR